MKIVFAVLSVLAISVSASALTLAEKKQYKAWQEYLTSKDSSYVETVKTKCGWEIPATLEEKFVTPFMTANANAASYCDSVRSSISGMCGDETSKTELKKKIAKVECKLATKPEEASFKINGKTLVFTFGVNASNLEDKTKTFLENNL